MEKWALKLGLQFQQSEYSQALHWLLTSAEGLNPALIGLTRLEGGDPPVIGVTWQLCPVQGCRRLVPSRRGQTPGRRGLRRRNPVTCYTKPKVAPSKVVQRSTEPVEGGCTRKRPAGWVQQGGHPQPELATWLLGGGVMGLINELSLSSEAVTTGPAKTSARKKKSKEGISLQVKIRLSVSVKSEGRSRDQKSHGGGVRGLKIVPSANFSVKTPPPAGVGPGGAGLEEDHLWRPGEPAEIECSDRWGGHVSEKKHQSGAKIEKPWRKEKSPATEPGGQDHTGGVNLPPLLLQGQHCDQASHKTEDLAGSGELVEGK